MDYAKIVSTVRRLIDKFGRRVTFQRLSAVVADVTKPWKGPGAPAVAVATETRAVFVPPSSSDLGTRWIDNELLKQCEQVCLVAPHATVDLAQTQTMLDAGVTWRLAWVQVLKPGDTVLLLAFGVSR